MARRRLLEICHCFQRIYLNVTPLCNKCAVYQVLSLYFSWEVILSVEVYIASIKLRRKELLITYLKFSHRYLLKDFWSCYLSGLCEELINKINPLIYIFYVFRYNSDTDAGVADTLLLLHSPRCTLFGHRLCCSTNGQLWDYQKTMEK